MTDIDRRYSMTDSTNWRHNVKRYNITNWRHNMTNRRQQHGYLRYQR
jgi:hypothetical protein